MCAKFHRKVVDRSNLNCDTLPMLYMRIVNEAKVPHLTFTSRSAGNEVPGRLIYLRPRTPMVVVIFRTHAAVFVRNDDRPNAARRSFAAAKQTQHLVFDRRGQRHVNTHASR